MGEKIDLAYPEHMQSSAYVFASQLSAKKKSLCLLKWKKKKKIDVVSVTEAEALLTMNTD